MMQTTKKAILISLVLGTVLFVLSYWLGKENAFLLCNIDLGATADYFFKYWTHTADGAVWVPITLLTLFFKRRYFLLVISAILFSTLFAQLSKNIFLREVLAHPWRLRIIPYFIVLQGLSYIV